MKRLLLIGLATILSIGSLATEASADHNWSRNRKSYHQEETSNLSPIPEPLKYRVERRPENVEQEIHKDKKWRRVDLYVQEDNYYREGRRHLRFRRYHYGTRNDPGRY
jgi:hypothetical protein